MCCGDERFSLVQSSHFARCINLAYATSGNGAPYSRSKLALLILSRKRLRAATNGDTIFCRSPSNLKTECTGNIALRLWSRQMFTLRTARDDSAAACRHRSHSGAPIRRRIVSSMNPSCKTRTASQSCSKKGKTLVVKSCSNRCEPEENRNYFWEAISRLEGHLPCGQPLSYNKGGMVVWSGRTHQSGRSGYLVAFARWTWTWADRIGAREFKLRHYRLGAPWSGAYHVPVC